VDVGARIWAEQRLEQEVARRAPAHRSVRVKISSFPFVGRLAASDEVPAVRAHAGSVVVGPLTLSSVDVSLHGVAVDRSQLFGHRQVVLTGIRSGTVTADLTAAALSSALGVTVKAVPGALSVNVLGQPVTLGVAVRDNTLLFRVAGLTVPTVAIPRTGLLPCVADIEVLAGRLRLSCTVHDVPPALLHRAARATPATAGDGSPAAGPRAALEGPHHP